MYNRLLTIIAMKIAGLTVVLLLNHEAIAADFTKAENPDCRIQMRGQIIKGDLDRFKQVDAKLPISHQGDTTEANTICLDSPGGSLSEAGRLAAYFYKNGVGTVVHNGQKCLSACSFMFMLGMAQGAEVAFINRKIHPNGQLGFHRPEISLDKDKDYKGSAVVKAFDIAILSTLDLLQISNNKKPFTQEPMVSVDLLKAAFIHRGQDFFYIDTVDKVGRWDIGILNLDADLFPKLNKEGAWNSCENHFRWGYDISKKFYPMGQDPEDTVHVATPFRGAQGEEFFDVVGQDAGLVEAGCILKQEYDAILACGSNEVVSVNLGSGRCDRSNYADKLSTVSNSLLTMLHPDTKISTLVPYVSSAQQIFDNRQAYYKRQDAAYAAQNNSGHNAPIIIDVDTDQSAKRWTNYAGFDLKGGDLYVHKGVTSQDCLSMCQNDGACSAATYDRWNRICILKDINNSWRLLLQQPKTDTFMFGEIAQNNIQVSQSQPAFKRRNDRSFPAPNNAYQAFQTADSYACEDTCFRDNQCHAYGYNNSRICSLYNLPGEYFPRNGSVIGIKEQLD